MIDQYLVSTEFFRNSFNYWFSQLIFIFVSPVCQALLGKRIQENTGLMRCGSCSWEAFSLGTDMQKTMLLIQYESHIRGRVVPLPLPHPWFCLQGFSSLCLAMGCKQMILLAYHRPTPHHNASVIHYTSSHHTGILSSHLITRRGRVSTEQWGTLRYHSHRTFITVNCYNCPIFLLVIVANLLLGLIYKLNFIVIMYVLE